MGSSRLPLLWLSLLLTLLTTLVSGQRIPQPQQPGPPPPPPNSNLGLSISQQQQLQLQQQQQQQQQQQNASANINMQLLQMQQKNDELANVKDENIKRVLLELSTLLTPSQKAETLARVAQLVGPLFYANFDQRKDQIVLQGRNASQFPQRLLSAFTDIQGEEVKALLLQKNLESLHAADFGFLPMAIHYALQDSALRNISGTKLAAVVKVNRGDTTIAYKATVSLNDRKEEQVEFLQSLGSKILPDVQTIIIHQVLEWWGDPKQWKDRELSLLTTSGDPLLAYLPTSKLKTLDDEIADRFTSTLGQSNEIGKVWWMKPMSLKKAWFELAKGARYFGAIHEWSFRRMQKLSFLLEGASPEDLELIPPIPEIKNLVISNHYTELQARVVFDAFYKKAPLSQEDLQEFQFHILDLTPSQLQRFDLGDSFSTLDDMMTILEAQRDPSYPTLLQISNFMWPIVNTTTGLVSAPAKSWQKRELSQMGKMLFLLPKSTLFQIPPELINWDSNTLQAIRSTHLTPFQIWYLTSQILKTIDDRFKPDYVFLMPAPFQRGIPTQNISQVLLGSPLVRPEVLRALIEESSGMLTSQQAVIVQRIRHRLSEATIIRNILSSSNPAELFNHFNPRLITKNMATIIKTIIEMPETGKFGVTSIQAKLLPKMVLSLWLNWVRESSQVTKWTAEDLLGRSPLGGTSAVNYAILGLSCRDVNLIDPLDILPVILHYRHELYALRNFRQELTFSMNLRTCLLEKVVDYLKIKSNLNGTQSDSHILSGLNFGEISGIGGEILSMIPVRSLDGLDVNTRVEIISEIGTLEMLDLFSLVPLEQIKWYGNTLLNDIQTQKLTTPSQKRKRQSDPTSEPEAVDPTVIESDPALALPSDPTGSISNDTSTENPITPTHLEVPIAAAIPFSSSGVHQQVISIDADSVQKLGNLLCYAEDIFVGNWSKQLLKDILESKTIPGDKTCCMSASTRGKWFNLLQTAYGADTSSWNQFDLNSIGDLLISVPEEDLKRISKDALAKAVSPIIKQSGFDVNIMIPGKSKMQRFVSVCTEALGTEGTEFITTYKGLMKQLSRAAQWMVNTVQTTDELIRSSVGRGGRLRRSAEEVKVVRKPRQIPISTGAAPATTTTSANSNMNSQQQQQPAVLEFPVPKQPSGIMPGQSSMGQIQGNNFNNPGTIGGSTRVPPPQRIPPMAINQRSLPPPVSQMQQNQPLSTPIQQQQQQNIQSQPIQYGQGQYVQPNPVVAQPLQQVPEVPDQRGPQQQQQQQGQFGINAQFDKQVQFGQQGQVGQNQFGINTQFDKQVQFGKRDQIGQQGQLSQNQFGQSQSGQGNQNQGQFGQAGQLGVQDQFGQSSQNQFGQTSQNQDQFGQGIQNQGQFGQSSQNQFGQQGQLGGQGQAGSSQNQFGQSNQNIPQSQVGFTPAQQGQFGPTQSQYSQPQYSQTQYGQGQYGQPSQFVAQPLQQVPDQRGPQQQQQQGQFGINAQFDKQVQFGQQGQVGQNQFGINAQFDKQVQFGKQDQFRQQGQVGQNQFGQGQFGQQGQGQLGQANQNQFGQQGQLGGQGQAGQSQLNQDQFGQSGQGGVLGQVNQFGSDRTQDLAGRSLDGKSSISSKNSTEKNSTIGGSPDASLDERVRSLNFDTPSKTQADGHQAEITCHGIKAAGPAAIGLTIEDLQQLSPNDLFDCIETLGRLEWDEQTKAGILTLFNEKLFLTTDKLKTLTLIELGNLVSAFSANPSTTGNATDSLDVSMMDFTLPGSLDVLSILGSKIVDSALLKVIASKFNADNRIFPGFSQGIARPENLRIAVLALGNVICGFSDKIVNSIFESDASLFIDCSRMLGKLEGCNMDVLSTLATHAVRPSNYGPPRLWSQEDLETIGVVFAGLKPDAISTIPPEAMQGLRSLAIKSLPASSFLALSPDQITKMSFSAASSVLPSQTNSLSSTQASALRGVIEVQNEEFNVDIVEQLQSDSPHEEVARNLDEVESLRPLRGNATAPGLNGTADNNATNPLLGRTHGQDDETNVPADGVPTEGPAGESAAADVATSTAKPDSESEHATKPPTAASASARTNPTSSSVAAFLIIGSIGLIMLTI